MLRFVTEATGPIGVKGGVAARGAPPELWWTASWDGVPFPTAGATWPCPRWPWRTAVGSYRPAFGSSDSRPPVKARRDSSGNQDNASGCSQRPLDYW